MILWCILYFFGDVSGGFAETLFGIVLGILVYGTLTFLFIVPFAIVISLLVHAVIDKKATSFFQLVPLAVIILNIGAAAAEYSMLDCFF